MVNGVRDKLSKGKEKQDELEVEQESEPIVVPPKKTKKVTISTQSSLKHFMDDGKIALFVTLSKSGQGFDLIMLDGENNADNCRSFVEVINKLLKQGFTREEALERVDGMANMLDDIAKKINVNPMVGYDGK